MTSQEKLIFRFLLTMLVIGLSVGFVRNRWYSKTILKPDKVESIAKEVSAIAEDNHIRLLSKTENSSIIKSTEEGLPSLLDHSAININTASKEELMLLPGIGPAMAERIIIYRDDYGNFKRVDDLMNVKGIGEKTLGRLRSLVTIE